MSKNTEDNIWHPYTKLSAEDLPVIVSGKGIYLKDTQGREYLDAVSSWWACNLGHSHPRLVKVIQEQAGKLQHSILGNLSNEPALKLADKLKDLFPSPMHVMYASDGASAVEAALKISVQYWHNKGKPEKCRLASLKGAYHGDTLGAVSVGFLDSFHKQFKELTFPVHQADAPFCAKCSFGLQPDATLGSAAKRGEGLAAKRQSCACECFDSMRAIITEYAKELAAVIVEPLCQGAAGMRMYDPKYLSMLADICKENDILLIADEIAVGYGRTGKMFAFEHAGIDPDIVCLGKGISGGYLPLSATVVKDQIFDTFCDQPEDHTFYHGHTFAGNPIACATAIEVLNIYIDDNVMDRVSSLSSTLKQEFETLKQLESVSNVRCLGMIAAADLPDSESANKVKAAMLEKNIFIRPLGNVIYLMLPFVTPEETIKKTVNELCSSIHSNCGP